MKAGRGLEGRGHSAGRPGVPRSWKSRTGPPLMPPEPPALLTPRVWTSGPKSPCCFRPSDLWSLIRQSQGSDSWVRPIPAGPEQLPAHSRCWRKRVEGLTGAWLPLITSPSGRPGVWESEGRGVVGRGGRAGVGGPWGPGAPGQEQLRDPESSPGLTHPGLAVPRGLWDLTETKNARSGIRMWAPGSGDWQAAPLCPSLGQHLWSTSHRPVTRRSNPPPAHTPPSAFPLGVVATPMGHVGGTGVSRAGASPELGESQRLLGGSSGVHAVGAGSMREGPRVTQCVRPSAPHGQRPGGEGQGA